MSDRPEWTSEELSRIFDKTGGYCRYCEKRLAWRNYGAPGAKAAWEVDHSVPLSRRGTNHMNNLFPACIPCNREKSDMTGREFQRLFEEPPSIGQSSPWEGLVAAVLGAMIVSALSRALRNPT